MNIIQGQALKGLFSTLAEKIKNANSVSLYCQNFNNSISLSSKESLFHLIVSELNKNHQKVKIHSFEYIQSLNTVLHQKQYENLQINKIPQEGALANFFSTIAPPNKYKTLQETLESIDYDKLQQALSQLKTDLKQELNNNESKLGDEYAPIKNDISKDLDEVFEQLQKHFQNINKNQNEQIAKTALAINFSVFVGVLSLLVAPVGIGVAIGLTLTGLSVAQAFDSYQEDKAETFSYSINPILEFLTRKTAMLIALIYPRFYNTTLIIDDEFYEFLGTDLCAIPPIQNDSTKTQNAFIAEQFVLCGSLPKNSQNDFSHFLDTTQNSQIAQEDRIFPLKNSLEMIKKSIQEYHHLAYIEAPCFNAIKLAKFFQTSLKRKNASKTQKGVLILSENPTKHNAGLSDYITQNLLANKIERGISTKRPTIESNKNTYNPQRDFSDYKIAIRANDPSGKAPFVLQLAPFAIQPSEKQDNSYAQDYINSCFKQPQDIKQIAEKENELLKAMFQKTQKKWESIQNNLPQTSNEKIALAFVFALSLSHISTRFGHIQDFQIQWEEEQCIIKYANESFCIKDFEVIEEQVSEGKTIKKQNFIPILKTYYDAYITSLNTSTNPPEKVPDLQKQVNQEALSSDTKEILFSIFPITDLAYASSKGWDDFLLKLADITLGVLQEGKKNLTSPSLESLITTAFNALLNYLIKNKKDLFKKEKEWLIHQYFTYPYDLPLALKRDFHQMQKNIPSVFYPIKVKPTLFCIDLSTTFFGGRMDSTSYENQLGWLYKIPTDFSLIQRILKYIIIDELRGGKLELDPKYHISDDEFFQRDLSNIRIKDYMFNPNRKEHKARMRQYSSDSRKKTKEIIQSYNTALSFLTSYQNSKATHKAHLSIAFLQALDAIGKNNIKALYVGVNQDDTRRRPLFVGRLATTIIIEDGLWIG